MAGSRWKKTDGTREKTDRLVEWFGGGTDARSRPPRVPCAQPDGSMDLCYRTPADKIRLHRACEATVYDNCRAGARRACSLAARRAVRRRALVADVKAFFSGWGLNFAFGGVETPEERAGVADGGFESGFEDRVMAACLARTDDRCRVHSIEYCNNSFK